MASPFPGMDPYLESDLWQEFHDTLASAIRAQLTPRLPPRYTALLSKRYVIDRPALGILDLSPDRVFYPDAHIIAVREAAVEYPAAPGVTAPAADMISVNPEEVPLLSLEIRDVAERRLVTAVEILSPVNKRGDGLREYQERRMALFQTRTHILEIDLLRAGARLPLLGELPPGAYYVYLSRFTRRPRTEVWAMSLRDKLPVVPVPLLPPDEDVPLDLQSAIAACFDLVRYERLIDYTQPLPPPPLEPDDAAWLTERVRAAQQR